MSFRASTSKLVTIAVVLVAALFFFHGSDGGYQATNGPTSTLKECAVGLLLQSLILLLARVRIGGFHRAKCSLLAVLDLLAASAPLPGPTSLAPLRC
ncbi:MAG TPA: hypothetical protein VF532_21675 [Candidatus Angelobacter sp.]